MWNANSVTNYTSFDARGEVVTSNQTTGGQVYTLAYAYNLAGALTAEMYPSGRTVTTGYDTANRAAAVQGTLNGQPKSYASQVNYLPHGGLDSFTAGNNLVPVYNYNSRLEVSNLWTTVNNNSSHFLLNIVPNWGTTNNNGNLLSVSEGFGNSVPWNSLSWLTQNYSYDSVNRLSAVADSGYTRSFGYDAYGNSWVTRNSGVGLAGNTPTSNVFNGANQRADMSYDTAGNQLSVNGETMAYDAENRQVAAADPPSLGGGTENYLYDGAGQRVEKSGAGGTAVFVYDALGRMVGEYGAAGASSPCATCYLTWDHLGTTRLVTDQNANVIARHDYLPFGEEIPAGTAGRTDQWGPLVDNIEQKFTGQMRDQETGADYFNARYYGSALGRFTSPDPANAGADLANPQSWNAYAYALNNPLALVDPSGLDPFGPGDGDGCGDDPFCGNWGIAPPPIDSGSGGQSAPQPPSRPVPVTVGPSSNPNSTGVYAQGQWGSFVYGFQSPGIGGVISEGCLVNPLACAAAGGLAIGGIIIWENSPPGPVQVPAGWRYTGPRFVLQKPTITLKGLPSTGKPKNAPTGTIPIDQVKPRLPKELIHEIKDEIGAGPRDWVGVAPNGDIITSDPAGNAVNHGPWFHENPESTEKFSLSVRFRHTTREISGLAEELGLRIHKAWKAGEAIRNKAGSLTGSKRTSSYVSARIATSQNITLFNDVLETCVRNLQNHEDAIRRFVDNGGAVEFMIGWFFEGTSGLEIQPGILARMGNLGIALSLFAYGEREELRESE